MHWSKGTIAGAFSIFKQALEEAQLAFDDRHLIIAQAHNDLGLSYFSSGQLDSSWYHHQKALAIRLEKLGASHTKVADSYNNLANVLQIGGQPEEALKYYQQVLQIRQREATKDPLLIASALNNLGSAQLSIGNLESATRTLRKALQIRKNELGEKHPKYGRSLQNIGNAFFEADQLDSAQFYFQASLENAQINYDTAHPYLADLYDNLGNCTTKKLQLDTALNWYLKAMAIREKYADVDAIKLSRSYLNVGNVQRQKGNYLTAFRLTEKGWAGLYKQLPKTDPSLADAWEKLGHCHQAMGHLLEAREAYSAALDIRWEAYGAIHPLIAGIYKNLGNLYWQQSAHASARYYYQEALGIWQQLSLANQREKASLYSNIGNSYLKEKDWQNASTAYRRALDYLQGQDQLLQAPIWQQLGLVYDGLGQYQQALEAYRKAIKLYNDFPQKNRQGYIFTLGSQATTYLHLYQEDGRETHLQSANEIFNESLHLLTQQQLQLLHPESRQKTLQSHYDLFAGAIDCQLAQWTLRKDSTHLWRAFQLSEESKSLRLREKWLTGSSQDYSPKRAGRSLGLEEALHTNEATAKIFTEQVLSKKAVLSFFSGPEYFFWFCMANGKLQIGKINGVNYLNGLIGAFNESISAYPSAGSQQKVVLDSIFRDYALELYEKVWLDLEPALGDAKELVIIPDGFLAYLPFSALLTKPPDKPMRYRSYPFLLQDFKISYAYSVTLLAQTLSRPKLLGKASCLAVAPTFEGHIPSLAPLSYNISEVQGLAKLVSAETLQDSLAKLDQFLTAAPNYQVLHLATHGVANIHRSEFSFLAFSVSTPAEKGRLYVQDLYQIDLPVELVVMSACQSGTGLYQAGEGAISLGRGFITAGARSVVSTLWNVNDAKTAAFMVAFYRYLKKGEDKDSAIRQAQQQYIQQASQDEAHPFYWAAYQAVGDMSSLKFTNNWPLWWSSIGLLGLILLAYFGLKPRLLKNFSK